MKNAVGQPSALGSALYKTVERALTLGVSFVLGIILARLLGPDDYGQLSLLLVVVNLLQVFVQSGLNTALVQARHIDDNDCLGVMAVSLALAIGCYLLIWFCAPLITAFYELDGMTTQLRSLAVVLFPGALNSIQIAILTRRLEFRKMMWVSFVSTLLSGVAGIVMAYNGLGLWALILQQILSGFLQMFIMLAMVKLKLSGSVSFGRCRELFSYGWKVLSVSLLETGFTELQALVIGKKFSAAELGYYNKGKQFPTLIGNNISIAGQAVLLPYISRIQSDAQQIKEKFRQSIRLYSFCMFPLMAGMAIVAVPLVRVLLTDKWLDSVPYLRLMCAFYAMSPVVALSTQVYNGIGKPEITLKLSIVKFILRLVILVISVFCFHSVWIITLGLVLWLYLTLLMNLFVNRSVCGYRIKEFLKDILPALLYSAAMALAILPISRVQTDAWIILAAQAATGALVYVVLARLCKDQTLQYLLNKIKGARHSKEDANA